MLSGHSLGGALADLTGVALTKEGYDLKVVSFGSFRVGDSDFADFAHSEVEHYRMTSQRDLVVHYPFRMMGYRHHGHEFWFDGHDVKICDNQ